MPTWDPFNVCFLNNEYHLGSSFHPSFFPFLFLAKQSTLVAWQSTDKSAYIFIYIFSQMHSFRYRSHGSNIRKLWVIGLQTKSLCILVFLNRKGRLSIPAMPRVNNLVWSAFQDKVLCSAIALSPVVTLLWTLHHIFQVWYGSRYHFPFPICQGGWL